MAGYLSIVFTTWGLVLWAKRRVDINGKFIATTLDKYDKRVSVIETSISTMRSGVNDSLTSFSEKMPDLTQGIQIDMQAMAQQLAPLLQESMANTINGMKGAEKKSLQKAAVMLQEGFEELQHDEFLQDVAAGIPEAIQIANAASFLQGLLPGIIEKSPDGIIAQYGPVLTQNAGKLYQLRKQRNQGGVVQGRTNRSQGGFNPGVR
jgi:hypothetical protein